MMVGETIWLVMHVKQSARPVAWRMTEVEAEETKEKLALAAQSTREPYSFVGIFFVCPVTNE